MTRKQRFIGLFSAVLLSLSGIGCLSSFEEFPPDLETGLLTVDWTIAGSRDPRRCATFGASEIELRIFDGRGDLAADAGAACEDFSSTLELIDGYYDAEVTMLDDAGHRLTRTLTLNDLDIRADTDLVSDLDFPASAFF